MTDHDEGDDLLLREGFRRLREEDARVAPSFATLMAGARNDVAAGEQEGAAGPVSPDPVRPTRRNPWVRWLPPVAAAAVLGAVLLSGSGKADREFDRVVNEWSQTARVALHSPTDRLLAVPGSQYLRSMPRLGGDRPASTFPLRSRP